MAEEKPERPVSFKLDTRLVADLDAISGADRRTRSATVRIALIQFVESRKGKTKAQRSHVGEGRLNA